MIIVEKFFIYRWTIIFLVIGIFSGSCRAVVDASRFQQEQHRYQKHHDHNNHPTHHTQHSSPSPSAEPEPHTCIHDEVLKRKLPHVSATANYNTTRKRLIGEASPIRIFFDLRYINDDRSCRSIGQETIDHVGQKYICRSEDVLTDVKFALLQQQILLRAHEYIRSVVAVAPVVGALKLGGEVGGQCGSEYGSVPVPPEYSSAGRDGTDLIVFVTTWSTGGNIRAYAVGCANDDRGRPVAGHLNVNPSRLDDNTDLNYGTVLHELIHVLGFNANAFYNYRAAMSGIEMFIEGPVTTSFGKPVYRVKSSTVLERARAHYGCPSLAGVELEDKAAGGGIGSHWEKRILGNELMTPTISQIEFAVSDITLALLEDSGWYRINYQNADNLVYALGQGCQFVTDSCSKWSNVGYARCSLDGDNFCAFDGVRYGPCSPNTASDECIVPSGASTCHNSSAATSDRGETFGMTSRCFHAGATGGDLTAHCFTYTCNGNTLTLNMGGETVACPRAEQVVPAPSGKLVACPSYSSVCCECGAKGRCVNGRCICERGFSGGRCETAVPMWQDVVPAPTSPPIGSDIFRPVPKIPPRLGDTADGQGLGVSVDGLGDVGLALIIVGAVCCCCIVCALFCAGVARTARAKKLAEERRERRRARRRPVTPPDSPRNSGEIRPRNASTAGSGVHSGIHGQSAMHFPDMRSAVHSGVHSGVQFPAGAASSHDYAEGAWSASGSAVPFPMQHAGSQRARADAAAPMYDDATVARNHGKTFSGDAGQSYGFAAQSRRNEPSATFNAPSSKAMW